MKKIVSAIAFVAIAMASGAIVSIYRTDKSLAEANAAEQVEIVETAEDGKMEQPETESIVLPDEMTFSCEVSGCTLTEVHQHGLCGIDGCMQIGEHSHGESSHEEKREGHHGSGHGGSHH